LGILELALLLGNAVAGYLYIVVDKGSFIHFKNIKIKLKRIFKNTHGLYIAGCT
jgi:hypothetical protein